MRHFNRTTHLCRARGISLLETLIVLVVVSATATYGFPSILDWRRNHLVTFESERLRLALEEAYIVAMSSDQPVITTFSDNRVQATLSDGAPVMSYAPRPPIKVWLKSPEQKRIVFYPTLATTPATIMVGGQSLECSVVLSLRGRVRSTC